MEVDVGVQTTVSSLLQLAKIRLPLVVQALLAALEQLSKVTRRLRPGFADTDVALELSVPLRNTSRDTAVPGVPSTCPESLPFRFLASPVRGRPSSSF